jgi:hypothetical protein
MSRQKSECRWFDGERQTGRIQGGNSERVSGLSVGGITAKRDESHRQCFPADVTDGTRRSILGLKSCDCIGLQQAAFLSPRASPHGIL